MSNYWAPKLHPKGLKLYNDYHRHILVSGSRLSGKTVATGHRVMRHLWETQGAFFGIFAVTIKNAKNGGVWTDMTEIIVPQWIDSKMSDQYGKPIHFTTVDSVNNPGPKTDGQTRSLYFKISNYWGGESECMLFSLDNENEIKAKLKSTRLSGMWWSELSEFYNPDVFRFSVQQLRMYHLKREQHLWIADTNPSEEGEDSWIHKIWYKERTDPAHKHPAIRDELSLHEMFLEDNPFLTPIQIEQLQSDYENDPGEYARIVEGRWVKGHGTLGKVFADLFSEAIHVIDGAIDIDSSTHGLLVGWDIGGTNHSATIIEERSFNGKPIWNVIDEVVSISDTVSIEDFTHQVMEKMADIEKFYNRSFEWEHWSDDTAINVYRPTADTYDYLIVRSASEGKIELQGVTKPDGSVKQAINMFRVLLREQRVFMGRNCPHTIEMFHGLKRGTTRPVADDKHKHPFDSLRYGVYQRTIDLMAHGQRPAGTERKSGLTSVGC